MAHDVFISHSSKDKVSADAICAGLEARGIRCWIAPRDIAPGLNYAGQLYESIESCKIFLVILTDHANLSTHILKEVELAVQSGKSILPFKIEDISLSKDLKYYLSNVHWLDAITPPLERHIIELGNFILKLLDRPNKDVTNIEKTDKAEASPIKVAEEPNKAQLPSRQRKKKKRLPLLIIFGMLLIALVAGGIWLGTHPQVFLPSLRITPTPTITRTATNTPVPPTPTITPSPTTTTTPPPVMSVFIGIPRDYTNCRDTAGETGSVVKVFRQNPIVYIHAMDETYEYYSVEYINQDGTSLYCWVQKYQLDFPFGLSHIPTITPTPLAIIRTGNDTTCFKSPDQFSSIVKTFQQYEQMPIIGRDKYMEWFLVQVGPGDQQAGYQCWIHWNNISSPEELELLPIITP